MATLPHEGTFNILYSGIGIPAGSDLGSGYLARPDMVGQFPVILVLPDIYGVTSFEKDMCRRLARRGMAAIALDLYRGNAPPPSGSMDEAVLAYQQLSDSRVITDIGDAHAFVMDQGLDWAEKSTVGILGADIGGRFGLLYAAGRSDIGAVCVVQAPLAGDEHRAFVVSEALPRISVPVLGLYGATDELIPASGVDVAQGLNPNGMWVLYDETGHGFLDDGAVGYHPGAANDAYFRISKFFLEHLPPPNPAAY